MDGVLLETYARIFNRKRQIITSNFSINFNDIKLLRGNVRLENKKLVLYDEGTFLIFFKINNVLDLPFKLSLNNILSDKGVYNYSNNCITCMTIESTDTFPTTLNVVNTSLFDVELLDDENENVSLTCMKMCQ
jgi:hypothetical protein